MSAAASFSFPNRLDDKTRGGFRAIFGEAPVAAALCSDQGQILDTNSTFARMFRIDPGEVSRHRLFDLVDDEDREETETMLRDLISGRRAAFRFRGRTPAADRCIADCTVWHVPGCGDDFGRALILADETTQAECSAEQLLRVQRLETVGQVAGGVAHDFNNLLAGVMLYCDLLLAGLQPGSLKRYTEEIRSAVIQATALVRQLLTIGRPPNAEPQTLCLNQTAQGMLNLLTRLVGENIRIDFRLDPSLGMVRIDAVQAQQVLLNLILNARDATRPGGQITLETGNCSFQPLAGTPLARSAEDRFPCVLLVVSDNGCGMDEATRARLFEPFFTTKAPGKGNGLGMTTVHNIVVHSGGLVHVESDLGRGTRVMVMLPRVREPAAPWPPQSQDLRVLQPSQNTKEELIL